MTPEEHPQLEVSDKSEESPLILDLNGPFVLHLKRDRVNIHAPVCSDHYGNLLTDHEDVSLYGLTTPVASQSNSAKGWEYRLSFKSKRSTGACSCDPKEVLKITQPMTGISAIHCNFVFEAPLPDEIVALQCEHVWMHQNGVKEWVDYPTGGKGSIVDDKRARSLRLIYKHCLEKPKIETISHPDDVDDNDTPKFENINYWTIGIHPRYRSLSLRFAANRATADEHHEDAYNCFRDLRMLVAASDSSSWHIHKWRVDFDNTDVPSFQIVNRTGKHPVDCGAMALVIQEPPQG